MNARVIGSLKIRGRSNTTSSPTSSPIPSTAITPSRFGILWGRLSPTTVSAASGCGSTGADCQFNISRCVSSDSNRRRTLYPSLSGRGVSEMDPNPRPSSTSSIHASRIRQGCTLQNLTVSAYRATLELRSTGRRATDRWPAYQPHQQYSQRRGSSRPT